MNRFLLAIPLLALTACATNPGIDHRVVCSLDGKAAYATTYGPLAFFNLVPDADVLCATAVKTPLLQVVPAVVPSKAASAP